MTCIIALEHFNLEEKVYIDEMDGGNISCSYDMTLLQNYALNNEIYYKINTTK